MSESDDTDLLLLIPPDFFVIHSDSEDSLQSFKKNNNDRFRDLISHVNELEERINFIENKDATYSESLPEANRINQPVDYSLIDTSHLHSVHSRDVAVRFNSLAFAGFQFGCNYDNSSMRYLEPYIMSSSENKDHPETVSPVIDYRSDDLKRNVPFVNPILQSHAHSLESSNPSLNSIIPVDNTGSRFIKCMTADENHESYKFLNHSQPFNFSFLSEIDEFLEKKNKLFGKSLPNNGFLDSQRKDKSYQLKDSGESANSENEFQPLIKLSSNNSMSGEKRCFGGDHERSHINEEVHVQQQTSDTYLDLSCLAESEETNMKKNTLEFYHRPNEKDFTKENASRESIVNKELNSSNFGDDAMYNSCGKFLKENIINGAVDEYPSPGNGKFLFHSESPYFNDTWSNRNSVVKPPTLFNEKTDSSHLSLNRNNDDHEYVKNQFGYQTGAAQFSDSCPYRFENSFNSATLKNKLPLTESVLSNKDTNFPSSLNELDQPRNFAQFEDGLLQSKPTNVQSSRNNDSKSSLKHREDEVKKASVRERGYVNSKLPEKSLDSYENVQKQTSQKLNSMRKESENYPHLQESNKSCEVSKGCIFISDGQSVKDASKLRYQSTNEYVGNQAEEKNMVTLSAPDGIGKGVPIFADDGYYSSVGTGSSAINFLSLSNLWGRDTKESPKSEVMTVEQKLEEEHYRRKHCENVIQKLQCTVLELQQKLAVAMRVDQSKDNTIHQLQTAWKRLIVHWQELEEQRHAISIKYSEEKEKNQQYVTEIMQKVKQCELELSKALDLAKGYKEKSETMEKKLKDQEDFHAGEKRALQFSLQEKQSHLVETERKMGDVQCEIAELKEKVEAAEKKSHEERESVMKYQEELKNTQHMLGNLENEKLVLKEENEALRLRVKEEKSRNNISDQQIKGLKNALDECKKNEKTLQGKLKDQTNTLEKCKTELRDYYQQQVEFVVQEKLVEFQTQLDAAEASLHQEMEQREKLALEAATKQIKHITEKNLLEVKLLEEKHREELHLCKLQLAQATQKINQLQEQLQTYSNRKVEIVEKLHSVMETQWQEALRIISGNSPLTQSFQEQHVLEKNIAESIPDKDLKPSHSGNCTAVPPLLVPPSSSSSTTDDVPFNKEDQLTYRANSEQPCNHDGDINSENPEVVKKYIEMLLNRPPGDPLEHEISYERRGIEETPVIEENTVPKWGNIMEKQQILSNVRKILPFPSDDTKCIHSFSNHKFTKPGKPPWK